MKVIYAPMDPADGDRQEWEIDLDRIRVSEAELIEKAFGGTKAEFDVAVLAGNARARRVLVWRLICRAHPNTPLASVPDFYTGDVEIEGSLVELERWRDKVQRSKALTAADRRDMLAALDAQIAAWKESEATVDGRIVTPDEPGAEVVTQGKASRSRS